MAGFQIRWIDGVDKDDFDPNYVDEIPFELIRKEGLTPNASHPMLGPKGGRREVRCQVQRTGKTVELDYRGYASVNKDEVVEGVLRLEFLNDDLSGIPRVYWQEKGSSVYLEAKVEISRIEEITSEEVETASAEEDFDPKDYADARLRIIASIARRQGQANFRRQLMNAYSGRCAITDCAVAQVLEAAHIAPYWGPKTNDVRNGLLLRADIHTLFDLKMISVDVANGVPKVILHSSIRGEQLYSHLHKKEIRLPRQLAHRPSVHALTQHYLSSKLAELP